ncbi:baseplate J/gp47 family protein [Pseudomonas fortuita]|uniref:baseplate J/gp47 family protein n=1 Tax=Pseudomonas fortuita TaxID=3233375 RepID=UPI003D816B62
MAEITDQGITGTSLNDYLADINTRTLAIDPDWNIDPDTPDGQRIGIEAEMLSNLDEGIVAAYRAKDPDSATGEALRNIGKISGVAIRDATYSVAPITITGPAGTVLPASSQIRSKVDNTLWLTTAAIVIGVSQSATGFATCVTPGRVLAGAGELTVIGTPYPGWSSVTNTAAAPGEDAESDVEFRSRRNNSVSLPGSNMKDNMLAAVANVAGVTDVKILENNSDDPVDPDGIPYTAIAVIVNGGTDQGVGQAMYSKYNPGTPMYPRYSTKTDTWVDPPGTTGVKVQITSPSTGNNETMTFQRAVALPIYVSVAVQRKGNLPSDIEQRIKDAIVEDSTKKLFSDDQVKGFNQGGYDIGEVVPVGRQYTPVNKVLGQYGDSYITSLTIGLSAGSQGVTPIQPGIAELATFDPDNITVSVPL